MAMVFTLIEIVVVNSMLWNMNLQNVFLKWKLKYALHIAVHYHATYTYTIQS